jgi:hypothetical protein
MAIATGSPNKATAPINTGSAAAPQVDSSERHTV